MYNDFIADLNNPKSDVILISRIKAAEMLNISLPVLDALLKRKKDPIPSLAIGKKICIPVYALKKWIENEIERQAVKRQEIQSTQIKCTISPDVKTWKPLTDAEMRVRKISKESL